MELTQAYLKTRIHYDKETGIFTRLALHKKGFMSMSARFGNKAITAKTKLGYIRFSIDHKAYYAHRLAFLYINGEHPKLEIDHINGDKSDNRWRNLREVDHETNTRNAKLSIMNKSGILGVHWVSKANRWRAEIGDQYLGQYVDVENAIKVRKDAEIKYNYHQNHGRAA